MSSTHLFRIPESVGTIAIVVLLILVPAIPSSADSFVTPAMLQEAFSTQDIDEMRRVLSSVRNMQYKGEVLPVLHDVWRNKREKYSKLDWTTLNKPIIRAELANILSQGWRNGVIRLDVAQLHSAAISMVDSEDVDVVLLALQTLEVFDDESDVKKIASIARKEEIGTFQMAISTLTLMCNVSAEKVVKTLIAETKDKAHQQFIKDTKHQSDSFKNKASFCSRKIKPIHQETTSP